MVSVDPPGYAAIDRDFVDPQMAAATGRDQRSVTVGQAAVASVETLELAVTFTDPLTSRARSGRGNLLALGDFADPGFDRRFGLGRALRVECRLDVRVGVRQATRATLVPAAHALVDHR
jgi:hypothetical protein